MAIEVHSPQPYQAPVVTAPTGRQELVAGLSAVAPLLLGAIPFGLIYGVLAVSAGLPATMAQAMSTLVFAGSAQFITTQLLHERAPLLVILLTAVIVNLRHVLYSASMAPYLQHLNGGWKALLAYLLTDEAYIVAITRYARKPAIPNHAAHWYFLGAGGSLWITWQLSTAVGVFLGAQIPAAWSLDFAMPLTFIAIVVPAIKDRASGITALVAGGMILLTLTMPLKLGLLTTMIVAIGLGYAVGNYQVTPSHPPPTSGEERLASSPTSGRAGEGLVVTAVEQRGRQATADKPLSEEERQA